MSNAYETLGLTSEATQDEIKAAYRTLRGQLHPDRHNGCEDKAEAFRKVQRAYEQVGTEEAREAYDLYGDDDPSVPNVERDAERFAADLISQALGSCKCAPSHLPSHLVQTFDGLKNRASEAASSARVQEANLDQFEKMIEQDRIILAGFAKKRAEVQKDLREAEHGMAVIKRAEEMVLAFAFSEEG